MREGEREEERERESKSKSEMERLRPYHYYCLCPLTSTNSLTNHTLLAGTLFKENMRALQSTSEEMCGEGLGIRTTRPDSNPERESVSTEYKRREKCEGY